jgi:hypothetical protein
MPERGGERSASEFRIPGARLREDLAAPLFALLGNLPDLSEGAAASERYARKGICQRSNRFIDMMKAN